MKTSNHALVLQALSHRSRFFHHANCTDRQEGGPHTWGIDETSTIDTLSLSKTSDDSEIQQQECREINMLDLHDDVLKVHGFAPPRKAEGVVRLVYDNVNGFNTRLCSNEKVEKLQEIHNNLQVDIAAYCEHQINMCHNKNVNGFNQLFKGGEAPVRSVVAHNIHENIGQLQQGGTSLIMFGSLGENIENDESGKDETGLGRWAVMTLQDDRVRTRIVCAYNPCGNAKLNSGTTYQQQRRFLINSKNGLTCPQQRFKDDLILQLTKWRKEGDWLIVCMDANKNIYRRAIGCTLTDQEGLTMVEVVGEFTGKKIGPTLFRGSTPINGVWATADVVVTHPCVMPAGYKVGDHRMFMVDFKEASFIGEECFCVKQFASRRLNSKVSEAATRQYL
jgi:hypothetical protein